MTAQNATQCPPESALADFGLGKLDAASAETVSQRLETCGDCRQRVAGLPGENGARIRGCSTALLKAEIERGPDFLRLANALSVLYPKRERRERLPDAMLLAVPR